MTDEPVIGGALLSPEHTRQQAGGRTFVLTAQQSNTKMFMPWWNALQQYCRHTGAELHVSQFTYAKNALGAAGAKVGSRKASDSDSVWFDPITREYVSNESLQLAPGLVWCGELNILPTARTPFTGLDTYARDNSIIIPHAKMQMKSIATMKHAQTKFQYTTGAVTQRNYIQKKAGQVADFHHVFGAVVVEVDHRGTWWVRQLNAAKDGSFHDLSWKYTEDGVEPCVGVEAITHGDIHWPFLRDDTIEAVWGVDGIVDQLVPKWQFFHDSAHFWARNHHNMKDPHHMHMVHMLGEDRVEKEFHELGQFFAGVSWRAWCNSAVVVSNHDQAILKWLKDSSGHMDPPNAELWHQLNLYMMTAARLGRKAHPFKYLLNRHFRYWKKQFDRGQSLKFILEDDSHLILKQIEAGLHGHLGPNGARGSPRNLSLLGKANTAHTHSAGIIDGVYTVGVYGDNDMGYNVGPSSWSKSLVVTYPNAKRTVLTIKNGKAWR